MKKISIADMMPGGKSWWLRLNPGAATPTRERTGAAPKQEGISEEELQKFQEQEQEPMEGEARELTKAQAQKIGEARADGSTPEQVAKPEPKTIDRHARGDVNEIEVNDPAMVKEQAELIQKDKAGAADNTTVDEVNDVVVKPAYSGYEDILNLMKQNAVSDAEMARRARSRDIVTGLGDTISAIANMWGAVKGGTNGYDHSKGMSATAQARYDKMLAERKAQQDQILNYYKVKKAAEQEERARQYREDQLAENKRYHDLIAGNRGKVADSQVERNETAAEAAIAKSPVLSAAKAAFNETYYQVYEDAINIDGLSEEEAVDKATAAANRAYDNAYNAAVKEQAEQAAKAAEEKSQKTQSEIRRNDSSTNKNNAATANGGKTPKGSTKKGKQKKVAPKRKQRQNASAQGQTGSGNTMPGVKS